MTATVSLTREAIDRILEDHFQQEAAGDVEGTLQTLTDDVVHDVVGDPAGELHGPAAVGQRYGHLFSNVKGEHADVKHRLYGDNFVVDDKIWTARVVGEFMGIPGHGRRISIRVLHVFEFRDGRISRENVWIDAAAAIAQLTSEVGAAPTDRQPRRRTDPPRWAVSAATTPVARPTTPARTQPPTPPDRRRMRADPTCFGRAPRHLAAPSGHKERHAL